MSLIIQPEIIEKFHPNLGVITAEGVDNTQTVAAIEAMFTEAAAALKQAFAPYENPAQHPTLAAWRQAFKAFGTDPQRYRSSIEALARRVLKDNPLPRINTLVDLYNYVSIKHIMSIGGEDHEALRGPLRLAFADGNEPFIVLNGEKNDPPAPGEIVYKDDEGVICRMWNWREGDRTKLTKETRRAVIVIDTIPPTTKAAVEAAAAELAELIRKYCGGTVSYEILG